MDCITLLVFTLKGLLSTRGLTVITSLEGNKTGSNFYSNWKVCIVELMLSDLTMVPSVLVLILDYGTASRTVFSYGLVSSAFIVY
jgi:hypothetical protein